MPVNDVVVDTNVFMHAENKVEARRDACAKFVEKLLADDTHLCVDEGFDLLESDNRSQIGGEYLRFLRPGSIGYHVVTYLALNQRVNNVSRAVPANVGRQITRLIYDPTDRVFVKVAFNSRSQVFVSHDFANFPNRVRAQLHGNLGIETLEAIEI